MRAGRLVPPLGSLSFTFVPVVSVSHSEVQQDAIFSRGVSRVWWIVIVPVGNA